MERMHKKPEFWSQAFPAEATRQLLCEKADTVTMDPGCWATKQGPRKLFLGYYHLCKVHTTYAQQRRELNLDGSVRTNNLGGRAGPNF